MLLRHRPALALVIASLCTGTAGQAATLVETIQVTARLRSEDMQRVPIPMSVIGADTLDATSTINVAQLTQLAPSLNYTSPNPRNTALTIRGLGSSVVAVAQANDGLEPGVGFYLDQVYHARPATAAFDFLDLERVEILRGPQGTLFGKNTTAGAMNIVTRWPSFEPELQGDVTTGSNDFLQTRLSIGGALGSDSVAGRLSTITVQRSGLLRNINSGKRHNDIDNAAVRGQLLFQPAADFSLVLSADHYRIDSNCCTQGYYRTGITRRPTARQFPALARGLGYTPASSNLFNRVTDIDADLAVYSAEGGVAAVAEWRLQEQALTSVSAWRYWNWNAANDRDYTGLAIQTIQGIPSRQDQYSQELRLASTGDRALDYTVGVYAFTQTISGNPVTAYGPLASYWLLDEVAPAALLDGYRTDVATRFSSDSLAVFGEGVWTVAEAWELTGGLRYTYEDKKGRYDSVVSGGLATTDPDLRRQQLSILRPQSYAAAVQDGSFSGRLGLAWQGGTHVMPYLGWARGYKSGGINMSGLPLGADNLPALGTAVIGPELTTTLDIGIKSNWWQQRLLLNANLFHTRVDDFQANVVDTGPGTLRGYLANIDEVRVQGLEYELQLRATERLSLQLSGTWTQGEYASYPNGPCPLELQGTALAVCDLGGKPLAALPERALTLGLEYALPLQLGSSSSELWLRSDYSRRASTNGESANSIYTQLPQWDLWNLNLGFRPDANWEVFVWLRNALDEDYVQNLTVQAGNSGMIAGNPGDPRSLGLTVRATLGCR